MSSDPRRGKQGRWRTVVWLSLAMLSPACGARRMPSSPTQTCVPACDLTSSCADLDAQLVDARQPLLACVGRQAPRGELAETHRCYRALRLLESARWWLKTLLGQDELHAVYMPADNLRREFLCRIEALARARTAVEVEELYMEMIRAFP